MMVEKGRSNTKEYLILLLLFSIWGSTYVVSKVLLGQYPIFFVAFCRYLIAWIFLTIFLSVRKGVTGEKPVSYDKSGWIGLLLFGFIGYAVSIDCQLAGTSLIEASTSSLINAANPVGISLLSCIFLKEPITRYRVVGIGLGLFGVYLIIGGGGNIYDPLGIFFAVASVTLWSVATVISRKELTRFDPVKVTRDGMSIAVIFNFFLCAAQLISSDSVLHFDLFSILGLLYLGCVCTGGAHLLWNRALGKLPANVCSSFYPIQPLASTILGAIFLHERVGVVFFVGAFFIVAGIVLSLYEKKPTA